MTRYFDITDLVHFAQLNGTVSGIQRVQVRVIRHLASLSDPEEVICVFAKSRFHKVEACSARALFDGEKYNAEDLLAKLDFTSEERAYTRRELKQFLNRYPKGSVQRIIHKIKLYIIAFFSKRCARKYMELPSVGFDRKQRMECIKTWKVRKLSPKCQLVLIGSSWNKSPVITLAKHHHRDGGSVVQVIYDLIPHQHPEYCISRLAKKFSRFLKYSSQFVSHYICISEFTKMELEKYLARAETRTKVSCWPLAHEFEGYPRNKKLGSSLEANSSQDFVEQPFVLCVGTIEVRKNGVLLLRAWQQLMKQSGSEVPLLVFAGKFGWKIEAFKTFLKSDQQLRRRVKIIQHPSDDELASLYQDCLFTIFPSLAEGWGLPVGEAAWFGKYSIVSSSSSLPEVLGDLVDYIDPDDCAGMVRSLRRILNNSDYRMQKEQAIGSARLRSWKEVAGHLDQLLEE